MRDGVDLSKMSVPTTDIDCAGEECVSTQNAGIWSPEGNSKGRRSVCDPEIQSNLLLQFVELREDILSHSKAPEDGGHLSPKGVATYVGPEQCNRVSIAR